MEKLLFIYNAGSGNINTSFDVLHKVFSPSTYTCNLCRITHGILEENETWKAFRKSGEHSMEFLHKDEFQKQYKSKFGHKFTFPIVLAATSNELEVFISSEEINAIERPEELISLIEERRELFR
ncbi:MAG: GTPase [Bacteroidota bacterium]